MILLSSSSFVVLCCVVVEEVKQLRDERKRIAELLVSEALQKGSSDNVSVVLLMFS